jgi:hypothetical protein
MWKIVLKKFYFSMVFGYGFLGRIGVTAYMIISLESGHYHSPIFDWK